MAHSEKVSQQLNLVPFLDGAVPFRLCEPSRLTAKSLQFLQTTIKIWVSAESCARAMAC